MKTGGPQLEILNSVWHQWASLTKHVVRQEKSRKLTNISTKFIHNHLTQSTPPSYSKISWSCRNMKLVLEYLSLSHLTRKISNSTKVTWFPCKLMSKSEGAWIGSVQQPLTLKHINNPLCPGYCMNINWNNALCCYVFDQRVLMICLI